MKPIVISLVILFSFLQQIRAQDPQFLTALNFDGVNDHVVIPKAVSGDFTIEFWLQTVQDGATGSNWFNGTGILDAAGASQNEFGLSLNGAKVSFGIGNQNATIFSESSVTDGTWNHIAVTRAKSTGLIKLYINGVPEDSLAAGTGFLNINPSILIGKNQSNLFFKGNLDDFRIWSIVRTRNEIQNNKNKILVGTETGLAGYYKFDHSNLTTLAVPNQDNRTGECTAQYFNQVKTFVGQPNYINNTTAINYTWPGAPFSGINSDNFTVQWDGEIKAPFSERYTFYANVDDGVRLWIDDRLVIDRWTDVVTATEYSDTITLVEGKNYRIRMQFYEHLNNASAKLSWASPKLAKEVIPFKIPVLKDETVNARHGTYNFFNKYGKESNFIPAFNPYPYPLSFAVASTDFGNALDFDGSNDLLVMPYKALNAANFENGFTVEFWIKSNLPDQSVLSMSIASGAYNELYCSNYRTAANNQNTSDYYINNKNTINSDWHHIAVAVDVATGIGKFYVDGIVTGTVNRLDCRINNECWTTSSRYLHPDFVGPDELWGLRPALEGEIRIFKLGQGINSADYFSGKIDELRIWNYARSGQQINEHKFIPAVGNEQGLIQYFNFNQGTPGGNNSGLINFKDLVSGETGELIGFNLDGATSNWVKSDINENNPEAPVITHLDVPSSIPGKVLTISGVNLASQASNYKITFGSVEAPILEVRDNLIKTTVPNGQAGLNKIRISSTLGTSKPLDFTIISTLSQLPFSWRKKTLFSQNKPIDNIVRGDLNQDGYDDFIMSGDPTLVYFQNNGKGDFKNGQILSSQHKFKNLSLADVDSDHDLDLIYTEDNNIVWLENSGVNWTHHQIYAYTSNTIAAIPFDYDKDGDNDLLVYGDDYLGFRIFENDGTGYFSFMKFIGSNKKFVNFGNLSINRVVVAKDFNNDGYSDVAAAYTQTDFNTDSLLVLMNNKNKGFTSNVFYVNQTGNALTGADINNDQLPDLLDVGYGATFGTCINSGVNPYFSERKDNTLLNGYSVYNGQSAEPADLNGDGFTDLLAANGIPGKVRSISWLQNNGAQFDNNLNPTFSNLFISDIPLDVIYGIPIDIDNDGDLDVITVSTADNRTMAFYHVYAIKRFETFRIPEQISDANINYTNFTIDVTVPSGTILKRLIPEFTLSPKATARVGEVSQVSGISTNDFQDAPVTYTITAEDSTTQNWTVRVHPLPANPTLITIANASEGGIGISWTNDVYATSTLIDVSTDINFNNFLSGYNAFEVMGSSLNLINLDPGQIYYIRLRGKNNFGLSTGYSQTYTFITRPAAPNSITLINITARSALLTWANTPGAISYEVDVSTSTDGSFTIPVAPYYAFGVTTNNLTLVGLTPGVRYQLRIRAVNASGVSANSTSASFITIPPEPYATAADQNSSNGFTANWITTAGAESYRVELSENNFISIIQSISTDQTSFRFQNLELGNNYSYRVMATNTSGNSGYSNIIVVVPTYSINIGSETFDPGKSTAGLTVSSPYGIDSVTLFYRGIYSGQFQKLAVPRTSGNSYEINITAEMQDSMGTEYFFGILDKLGDRRNGDLKYYYRKIVENDEQTIPFTEFGKATENYTLFSVPYELEDQNIESIFNPVLGKYDNTKWRLLHYEDGRNLEVGSGLNKIQLGKGYWFISAKPVNIPVINAVVTEANRKMPYKLNLQKGWNQIGNPFPINLSWKNILQFNASEKNISDLYLFESGNFKKGDLAVWGGGFVNVDEDVELIIPVNFENSNSGRISEAEISNTDISKDEWFIPLTLSQNKLINSLSGIGMHPSATEGRDTFDESCLPRMKDFLEISTLHTEYFQQNFMRDIVKSAEFKTWNFTISGSHKEEQTHLQWNSASLGDNEAILFLYDTFNRQLINMKEHNAYDFILNNAHTLKFLYAKKLSSLRPDINISALPYPNPFTNLIHIPVLIADASQSVTCTIYDLTGKIVTQLNALKLKMGYNEIDWNGTDLSGLRVGTGMYYYRVNFGNSDSNFGRIIFN